jgi:hypothetical protein
MDATPLTDNPFAILTFIAAPGILTNAASVLALSSTNRLLRTRDRMIELVKDAESETSIRNKPKFIAQVTRVEQQGELLTNGLRWIYVAIGSFAAASLVTLLGGAAGQLGSKALMHPAMAAGVFLGFAGVAGLIGGCTNLFRASQLALATLHEEAEQIRALHGPPKA